jgi:CRISPR/Cas system-associated protein Cas7 (RAMP superfamily)
VDIWLKIESVLQLANDGSTSHHDGIRVKVVKTDKAKTYAVVHLEGAFSEG